MDWITIIIISASAVLILAGAALYILGMSYKYEYKDPLQKNAEWGMVIILILSFFLGCAQLSIFLGFVVDRDLIIRFSSLIRILFFIVPLNYYLCTRQHKKHEQQNNSNNDEAH